jgi:hypothetical protein
MRNVRKINGTGKQIIKAIGKAYLEKDFIALQKKTLDNHYLFPYI